jgi:hypothetical protein
MRIIEKILKWKIDRLEFDADLHEVDEDCFYDYDDGRYYFDIYYNGPSFVIRTYGGKIAVGHFDISFDFKNKDEALQAISDAPFDVRYMLQKYPKTKISFYPGDIPCEEIYDKMIPVGDIMDIKLITDCI